ncbi:glycosyltransferase involved in cell wall biosynthesis [Clostridium acetobutylicum]|uniref:Glycosyltransferase domain containing protein n=1 Tax=Clostridium acetobutylicum (strain ATCC 824 / DSM 792 / JCM 1419 / IAM 19013 / LMG 5710 / NBRC 13948 / NRRL B-527 / VKM B-1787 / 2291 / W) TaxID=272562 RepID=Q97H37_CLOAB|nr:MULTISPECIES: glycosyltransferase [Clostridium]AAK80134.1 Glycosyltransferase domain containing protein [Clostridium acetobutylicum ATCC 824]ADZ21227.1 Glycosyltransferase domain containing protein [Clostridium acetobutylicum EA 2018]AEI32210.1 glycosyltransferase domain-containing protein [Clostridium acetobutylicum DSM 1731]AWV79441.1 glycosyltransferase family 2 protein [Clostridium acetobutylicum]MBC2394588.1 glycosyltransferase family 2 protein [Clostridium acetobutylicum]
MIKVKDFVSDFSIERSRNLIESPNVSIILCLINIKDYNKLDKSISLILNQEYRNFELIVVDDGQDDELLYTKIKDYINKDNRIVYVHNNNRSGLAALRINQALNYVRGEYITYQFNESYVDSSYLKELIKEIEKYHGECLVYGKSELQNGKDSNYVMGNSFKYSDLIYGDNIIPNNAILHNASIIKKYEIMDCSVMLKQTFFWDFLLRLASKIKFIYVDKVVVTNESFSKVYNNIYIDNFNLRVFRNVQYVNKSDCLKLDKVNDYIVDDIGIINGENFRQEILTKCILPWYKNIKRDYDKETSVSKLKKNLLVVKGEFDTSLDIMITNFIKILNDEYNMIYIPSSQLKEEFLENIDAAIFHRTYDFATNHFLVKLKKMNIPVSYWIDDDLLNFYKLKDEYKDLSSAEASNKKFELSVPGTSIYKELEYQLKNADAVVSYSPQISDSVRLYNDRIMELKLTVMTRYIKRYISKNDSVFKIAFIGTDSRRAEIKFFWEDFLEISNEFREKVEFYFWGYIPEEISGIKHSKVYTEGFTTSYYEYMNRLSEENFDIVVSPLFNVGPKLAKGLTKYIEAAVCGAIGVYSNVKPYETIEDGVNGFKFKNEKGELAKKIRKIIGMNINERELIFNNAKEQIMKKHSTESQIYKFKSVIEALRIHAFLQKETIGFILSRDFRYRKSDILRYALLMKNYGFKLNVYILGLNRDEFKDVYEICSQNDINVDFIKYDGVSNKNEEFNNTVMKSNVRIFHSESKIPLVDDTALSLKIPYLYSTLKDDTSNGEKIACMIFERYNKSINEFMVEKTYSLDSNSEFWDKVHENIVKKINIYDYIVFEKFFVGVKEQINTLLNNENSMNYAIWGASNAGKIAKLIIDEALPKFNLVAFIDKYKKGKFDGYDIHTSEDLKELNVDYVFVATSPGRYEAEQFLSKNHLSYLVLFP